jgi:hypothetical protein
LLLLLLLSRQRTKLVLLAVLRDVNDPIIPAELAQLRRLNEVIPRYPLDVVRTGYDGRVQIKEALLRRCELLFSQPDPFDQSVELDRVFLISGFHFDTCCLLHLVGSLLLSSCCC